MIMYKVLHTWDDVDRLYVSRKKKEGRELTSVEDCVDTSIQQLEYYIKNAETDYSHKKQYWQHEDPLNGNNKKIKLRCKTTPLMF